MDEFFKPHTEMLIKVASESPDALRAVVEESVTAIGDMGDAIRAFVAALSRDNIDIEDWPRDSRDAYWALHAQGHTD